MRPPSPALVLIIGAALAGLVWWFEQDFTDGTLEISLLLVALMTGAYWIAARRGWP